MLRLMRMLMRLVLTAFTLWITIQRAWADPSWIDQLPSEDDRYKYYVGRSSAARDESQAFREALKDAIDQAVRSNFGVQASISSDSIQTEESSRGVVRISERTRDVRLQEFEQNQYHVRRESSSVQVWVLCRYSREAIRREKIRLAREEGLPIAGAPLLFSQAGGEGVLHQTDLELVTDPSGAKVLVNGEVYGKTPLRIQGQLPAGSVTLLLDHPTRKPIESRVILVPGKTVRVNEVLVMAKGTLQIQSEPSGASVRINGLDLGRTPLENVKLDAGMAAELVFTHPNTETVSQIVPVERNTQRRLQVKLPLKPGRMVYQVEPRDSQVTLDGHPMESVGATQLPPGNYRLLASRDGFIQVSRDVEILPGETTELGQVTLLSVSEEAKRRKSSPWILELATGYLGSPSVEMESGGMILSLGVQKRFLGRITLGVRAGGSYYVGGELYGDSYEREFKSTELGVLGRFRLGGPIHVDVEDGRLRGRFTVREDPPSGSVNTRHAQVRTAFRGYGLSWEGNSAIVAGGVRRYADTGETAVVVRVGLLEKW